MCQSEADNGEMIPYMDVLARKAKNGLCGVIVIGVLAVKGCNVRA